MTTRSRVSSLAVIAVLSILLTSLVSSPAQAARKTRGKVEYGVTSWVAGTAGYSIQGKASGAKHRRVALQVKWADGWHTIDKSKTAKKGKFTISGTLDWYGAHKLRVSVPRTRRDAGKNFKNETFTISPSWVPRGLPTAYTRESHKGTNFQWDPCKTIHYRINPGTAGEGVIPFTQEAVLRLERATGFKTKYLGTTTSVPLDHKRYQKGTDLVIAWSHQDAYPELVDAVGLGGFASSTAARRRSNNKAVWSIRHMEVTINMETAAPYPLAFDSPDLPILGTTMVHELGHAVGLDHFYDGLQVMHAPTASRLPTPTGFHADYEAGDLAGLRLQGAQGGCLKPYHQRKHGRSFAFDPRVIRNFTQE